MLVNRWIRLILIALALSMVAPATGFRAQAADKLPQRPLPADHVEGFGEGKVLAFHYTASYVCMTTPSSDLDGLQGQGDGNPEAQDPTEYQLPPCFLGKTSTGSIPPFGPDSKPLSKMRKLYGIALVDNPNDPTNKAQVANAFVSNAAPATDLQTQCAQPGLPYTHYAGAVGTCLMHPSTLRTTTDAGLLPLPQHSHIVAGTHSPNVWWHINGVNVYDRSIFPDLNGFCPAGPSRCLTSLAALRRAQREGLASADTPSNLFFRFSVRPEAPQPKHAAPAMASPASLPRTADGRTYIDLGNGARFYCEPGRGWGALTR